MYIPEKLKYNLPNSCRNYFYGFYYLESSICCFLKFDCYFRKSFQKESDIWQNRPLDLAPAPSQNP